MHEVNEPVIDVPEHDPVRGKEPVGKLSRVARQLAGRFLDGLVSRAERREWHRARNLADLGQVTARWLEGEIKYHPNGYDEGPGEETTNLIPALAALNRAGFVTDGSQPGIGPEIGYDGQEWWQRAAVSGFADREAADRLEAACAGTDLIFIRYQGARWRCDFRSAEPVTSSNGDVTSGAWYVHTSFGTRLSRSAVKLSFDGYLHNELCAAEQVTVIDPQWGRNDHLWPIVVRGLTDRRTG